MPKLNKAGRPEAHEGGGRRSIGREAGRGRPVSRDEVGSLFAPAQPYETLYLAVSGGPDSLAIMHLAADWLEVRAGAGDTSPKKRLYVLTVNHGLRPESEKEARLVMAWAAERGIDGEILRVEEPPPVTGIQEWARDRRYDLLCARVAEDQRPAALMTGHHEGDVAETFLMRLARGSGVDGLAQIAEATTRGGVAILRPLLTLAKTRLIATLEARGVPWIEDPSNAAQNFERVRLRQFTSERAALGLDDVALATTARRLRRAREALDALTDVLIDSSVDRERLTTTGVFAWPWPAGWLPDESGIRLLTRALLGVGGTRGRLRLSRIERLYDEVRSPGFSGATLGHCVIRPARTMAATAPAAGMVFEIFREPDREPLPVIETDFACPVRWDNRFIIERIAPGNGRAIVRAFAAGDLEAVVGADEAARVQLDDALRATPVIAEVDGGLAIPALGLYRAGGAGASAPGPCPYRARFMIERLYSDVSLPGGSRKHGLEQVMERRIARPDGEDQ